MNKTILLVVIIILTVLALYSQVDLENPKEIYCEKDSDCVPAQCCHPTSCVNKNYAPDCSGIFCTMECKPDTLDCGQGKCVCINNKCEAEIEERVFR